MNTNDGQNGDIIDPNKKINDDGTETILKEGDEGYVAPNSDKDDDDDKPKETPEEKVARLRGQLKRAEKDAGIESEKPEKKSSKKSDDLDYGQKAFLIANGVKDADEMSLVKDIMANTGKSLDDVIASKYFQSELTEMREAKATANAVPPGSKRTGQSSVDTVEYWLNKGELPPASERELRQKVVNARIKKEGSRSQFTETPVASSK